MRALWFALAGLIGGSTASSAAEIDLVRGAVPVIQPQRLQVSTPAGTGEIPIQVSRDWDQPQADITRAVIFIHGWPRRDLLSGERAIKRAGAAANGVLVITPQFLTTVDLSAHGLPATMLAWSRNGWLKGERAASPAPLSAFDAMDTIFQRLADRSRFPKLTQVVLAGHSAGAQYVQRYAAVGRGEQALRAAGIAVRYVVANPSSYLYLDRTRPAPGAPYAKFDANQCPAFDHWNHGMEKPPAYVARPVDLAALRLSYLAKNVVYLLGTADDDPEADGLDRSCGAQAQGPTRYTRGMAYAAYIHQLGAGPNQQLLEVLGVAHSSYGMYSSAPGKAALLGPAR